MNKKVPHQRISLEDLILAFRRKILEIMSKDAFHQGMTISQSEVLRLVGTGSQTMKYIADALNITPPSATALVEEMEKKGLVLRKKDPTDRRVVSIVLTKKSQGLFKKVCESKKAVMNEMLSKLSEKDKKTFERIISIIISK